jgi:hypothetical protein
LIIVLDYDYNFENIFREDQFCSVILIIYRENVLENLVVYARTFIIPKNRYPTHFPICHSFPDNREKVLEKGYAGGTTQGVARVVGWRGRSGLPGISTGMGCRGRHPENFPVKKYRIFLQ